MLYDSYVYNTKAIAYKWYDINCMKSIVERIRMIDKRLEDGPKLDWQSCRTVPYIHPKEFYSNFLEFSNIWIFPASHVSKNHAEFLGFWRIFKIYF
jgi:hypothetical protein